MSAMEYSGPDRRRGGSDRKAQDEITRILVVDDHALFRMGIANILGREPDFEIVAEAEDITRRHRSRHRDLAQHHPDGPLAAGARRHRDDVSGSSASCRPRASSCWPRPRTRTPCSTRSRRAPRRSSSRTSAPDDLVTIIRRVVAGEYLINDKVFSKPAVASRVLKEFRELAVYGQEAAPIFAPLSPREVEILDNIAQGMTNKQVAYALSISEQTVKNHMSSILRKLSVNDRTQAVVYAMRQGWIRMPED